MSKYDIAVIGMGCVFPEANNTQEYWNNILSGNEFVQDMPEHLWAMKQFWSAERQDHKSVTMRGSFLKKFDFNPIEYGIPPKNLEGVDRAQLVAMEATKQALADAGLKPRAPELEEAVTVIGASGVDEFAHVALYLNRLKFFREFGPRLDAAGIPKDEQEKLFEEFSQSLKERGHDFHPSVTSVGAIVSSLSNRVAQVFGVKGFNMCVDGACASSFVALSVACHALMAGDARIAIAGGVDLGINPAIYIGFSRLGGLSPMGTSNPFDNSADGLVIGEGGGVVILKRLEDALADGDRIQAVIRGIGTTSDGAGQAIYNPSAEQRTIALKKALSSAEIAPSQVQFLEAHATSTVVGDANEYDAIEAAYGKRDPSDPLYLGTVKHQIGHLKAAAGMAGLIKTVLAMNAGKIPHMPRFRKLTKLAARKSDALAINTEVLDWIPRENGSRYGAVTTSGFGGVNYHVILEQASKYIVRERKMPDRDMAIVGMVNRLPGAVTPEEFWENSLAGKNNFQDVNPEALGWHENMESGPENERIGTRKIGLIDDFDINFMRLKITPNSLSQISPAQILSAELSDRLLTECGYNLKDHKKIGVSIGSMHDDNYATISYPLTADEYGEAMRRTATFARYSDKLKAPLQETVDAVVAAGPPHTEATLPGWMSNINAGIVANRLNCRGPNFTVDTACSSGLASLMPSMYQLMFTDVDAMITGGLNRHTTNVFATAVDRLGAIAVDTAKPFDKDGAGFIAGEGGVLFLVKRLKDARAAGDTVHGIIRNIAGSSEYKSKSMVAPTEDALRFAIEEGMRNVSLKPEDIGVVDTHGSANRLSDIVEVGAIAGVLRPAGGALPIHVTAVKSHVGHVYGGSGSAGVLSVLGSLIGRQVPGIRNLENYRPEIEGFLDKACPQKKSGPLEKEFTSGGVTSLGLGGANYFAVISAGDEGLKNAEEGLSAEIPKTETASDVMAPKLRLEPGAALSMNAAVPEGVFVIRGRDRIEVRNAVESWIECGNHVGDESANLALTVSFDSSDTLKRKLSTVLKFMDGNTDLKPLENQGVYFSDFGKTSEEKLAFCFPGQGTHYVGMGRFLYENRPEFREVLDTIHELAKADLGFNLLGDLYGDMDPKEAAALLGGLDGAQISLFAVEVGLARVYAAMNIVPDLMVGHSFGEISALASQGVWSLEDGYRVVAARIRAARDGGKGLQLKMMSIICDDVQRDALLSLAGDDVALSNINAPGQFIFAGKQETILKIAGTAETLGLEARILDIGSAFHSRFMEDAVEPFRRALEVLPCRQPAVPIMSTITKDYISFTDSKDLARHLSLQLTTKLDMPTVVNRLYADGARHFLEIGPKWAVTKLISVILKDKPFTAVPSLHPKIGDEETFRRALAYITGLRRIGGGGRGPAIGGGESFVRDAAFMDYLKRTEPAVISLLNEAHRRYSGFSVGVSFSAPTSSTNPAEGPGAAFAARKTASEAVNPVSPFPAPSSAASPAQAAGVDRSAWIARSKTALAESTGYPEEMLGEELDLEADLGIDSVQRAEIWGKLVKTFALDSEARPNSIRTINELADELSRLSSSAEGPGAAFAARETASEAVNPISPFPAPSSAASPAQAAGVDRSAWIARSKTALAESTGYPEEMLGEELDLEADLGIDSVQRAEIWGKLVKTFALDSEARPNSIRTINELADELSRLSSSAEGPGAAFAARETASEAVNPISPFPAPSSAASPAQAAGVDRSAWIARSKTALAESTGYPEEMLGEELDLEADLGIDSVQRAEIWGKLVKTFALDSEARPNSIRTINELADELSRLSSSAEGPGAAFAARKTASEAVNPISPFPAPSSAASPAQQTGTTGNRLFYSGCRSLQEDEIESFDCRSLLIITADARSAKSWAEKMKGDGRSVKVLTHAEVKGLSRKDVDSLLKDADTVLYLGHGKVHSSKAVGTKLSDLLLKETHTIYETFRVLASSLRTNPIRLICPISQDGAFGADSGKGAPQGAFPAGFIRSLSYEIPEVRFQLIDTGRNSWGDVAEKMISTAFKGLEAGLLEGEWVKPSLRAVSPAEESITPLEKNDLVLVTGGARGIVFECVHKLAVKTGCRLLLTGRTTPAAGDEEWLNTDNEDIDGVLRKLEISLVKEQGMNLGDAKRYAAACRSRWEVNRNLKKLAADGIDAVYKCCDVSNRESLKTLIDEVTQDGEIRGVVHGAGVQKSKLFEDLKDDAISLTMSTKMVPLFLLQDLIDFAQLRLFSAFGSIAGLFGNAGQSDYALANDMLASAVTVMGRQAGIFAQTVEWTAWSGTGMVTDAESKRFKEAGLYPVSVEDGSALYLQAVLQTRLPRVAAFNKGAAFAGQREISPWSAGGIPRRTLRTGSDGTVGFDVTGDVYINQHLVRREPVVPGTFTTEILSEFKTDPKKVLKNIGFRRPVRVRDGRLEVEVIEQNDSLIVLPKDRPALEGAALMNLSFASASLGLPKRVAQKDIPGFAPEILKKLTDEAGKLKASFYTRLDETHSDSLITGPIFRGVKSTMEKDGIFYALLRLTDDAMRMFAVPGDFVIHPVMADMAIQAGAAWSMLRYSVMAIPYSIGELRVYKATETREAVAVCREIEISPEEAKMDIIVRETDGKVVFSMTETVLKTISGKDR